MSPQELAAGRARGLRAAALGEGLMGAYAVVAALLANSVALRVHAAHAGLEVLVGVVALVATRRRRGAGVAGAGGVAGRPGRAECLGMLLVSLLAGVAVVGAIWLGVERWARPPVLEGTVPGLVALGLAALSNFVFWSRFRELHAADGATLSRGRMQMHAHAVTVSLFALVAVVAGTLEAGGAAGGRSWVLRLDLIAGGLLAALMAPPLWALFSRASRGVFGGR